VYRIVPNPSTMSQVAALPAEALASYAEMLSVLALMPWNGTPQHEENPGGLSDDGRSVLDRPDRWCT
jgi:hypothetical protein